MACQVLNVSHLLDNSVDSHPGEPVLFQFLQKLAVFALAVFHNGGQKQDFRRRRQRQDPIHHAGGVSPPHGFPAFDAELIADAGKQHPKVIVNFGDGSHRGPGIFAGGFLLDGDGGGQAPNGVVFGFFHLADELTGRKRKGIPHNGVGLRRRWCQRPDWTFPSRRHP